MSESDESASAWQTRWMRRWLAPVFAVVVLVGVLFGFAAIASIGQMVSSNPAAPPWQAFVLAGVLGVLAALLVGGSALELRRARRR